jgi:hypothetical protein
MVGLVLTRVPAAVRELFRRSRPERSGTRWVALLDDKQRRPESAPAAGSRHASERPWTGSTQG